MACKLVSTAVAALALSLSPALAQDATPDTMVKGMTPFLTQQESGHWLTSNLIGQEVTNPGGETIGEVAALEIDSEGKVVSVVIEAGGFLGLGAKLIGVPYESVEHSKTEPGNQTVVIKASLEEIDGAPVYMTMLQKLRAEEAEKARMEAERKTAPAVPEPVTVE